MLTKISNQNYNYVLLANSFFFLPTKMYKIFFANYSLTLVTNVNNIMLMKLLTENGYYFHPTRLISYLQRKV